MQAQALRQKLAIKQRDKVLHVYSANRLTAAMTA